MKHNKWLTILSVTFAVALFIALTTLSLTAQRTHSRISLCDYSFVETLQ